MRLSSSHGFTVTVFTKLNRRLQIDVCKYFSASAIIYRSTFESASDFSECPSSLAASARLRRARGLCMVLWVSALRVDTHSTMHNLRVPQARACERHGTQTLSKGRVNVHREKVTAFPGRVQDL